jgi:5'-methylthioadenosine nucleosidase
VYSSIRPRQNGVKLREIYVSEKIYFYNRRIMLEKYDEYGLGGYPSAQLAFKKPELKPGIVCSGDSFDNSQTDYDIFIKQNCTAVDMEAAGVAWVSMLAKIPMFAIKGITDFVKGSDMHRQYEENNFIVTQNLSRKLEEILKSDHSLIENKI